MGMPICAHSGKIWSVHMNSIFKGELSTWHGRTVAWIDSLFIDHAVFRLLWSNLATVVPGKIYRCNHPTPFRLRRLARRLELRTLINLRGKTQSGSDALSREGGTAAQAMQQLSLRYGHIRQAKTGILDAFFLRFQREAEGRMTFLDWVRDVYDEALLRQDFHASGLASFIDDWILAHE